MTDAERKLWWHLRLLLGKEFHFRRQATIGPYFVDFACHEKRLVIEVDGSQHATRLRADAVRSEFLNSQGYRVLRFWNNEVLQQTQAVIAAVHEALCEDQDSAPTPNPSPPLASLAGGGDRPERADPYALPSYRLREAVSWLRAHHTNDRSGYVEAIGQSQAAPRTPLESPFAARTIAVSMASENA
jgi:very-short-patch-repair endonuclease